MRLWGELGIARAARLSGLCWALVSCGDAAAKQGQAGAGAKRAGQGALAQLPVRRVELVRASAIALEEQVAISGSLAADDSVEVKSKVGGRLLAIAVDLGSVVRRGQVIAQIEPVDYRLRAEQALAALVQARASLGLLPDAERDEVAVEDTTGVREARATLDEARASLERAKTLVARRLIGQADFEAANASFMRAESAAERAREEVYQRLGLLKQRKVELALARQALADASIRAPLDGVVHLRQASAGELLVQGAPVATVVRVNPLRLRVEVPERDAARIAVGQAVSVSVDERPGEFRGHVARLSPVLDEQSRTLVVEAEIPNPGELRPGSFARARIALGAGAPVVTVPKSALVVFAGIEKVIGVEAGRALERPVKTGRTVGGLVEVREGLEVGAEVVREPGSLQQGQAVQVVGKRDASTRALRVPERRARVE